MDADSRRYGKRHCAGERREHRAISWQTPNLAKKEEMLVMEQKPGRSWGVVGRQHLPLGKREDREVTPARSPAIKEKVF